MTLDVLFAMRKLNFWFCRKIELFWKHLIASLKDRNCLSDDYLLNSLVVSGLSLIFNFVLLFARFYTWLCRNKGNIPTIENFKPFLQQYKKEIKPFFFFVTFTNLGSLSLSLFAFPSYQTFPSDFPGSICKIYKANFSVNQGENMFN